MILAMYKLMVDLLIDNLVVNLSTDFIDW